jgi:glutamyl-tRNA reductase
MNWIKNISKKEYEELLKFPVYISLLAANSDNKLDEAEKKSAIKFSHIKTYSSDPLLTSFYEDADKVFEKNIQQMDKDLPSGKEKRDIAIKKELLLLEKIVLKLGKEYTTVMHRSMKSFTEHVSKAHHNVFEDFVFPMPIKGLTY